MVAGDCTDEGLRNIGMKGGYLVDSRGRSWGGDMEEQNTLEEDGSTSTRSRSEAGYSLRRKRYGMESKEKGSPKPLPKRPRWYNQTYVMFLTLRLENKPLPRAVLIPRSLELSEILSKRLGLPRLFGGKTPKNTASGLLTENRDKMFISFTDEKTKKIYFAPSFEPGNFEQALSRYNTWMSELIENVWPIQFGNVRQKVAKQPDEDAGDEKLHPAGEGENNDGDGNVFIPKSVEDIFEVKASTIQNAGRGLFSKIYIPPRVILGYYFGVPYPEDEFDYVKGNRGHSGEFAHKYRLTILDATDENGLPFYNHPRVFCPFHFINESVGRQNLAFIEGLDVNQIFCMSIKPIYPGEETFVSYGPDVERPWLNADRKGDESTPSGNSPSTSQTPPKPLYDYTLSLYESEGLGDARKRRKNNATLSPSTSTSSTA